MPFTNEEMDALVRVGPGTPSGEVWRRFWLPVECSANLGPYVRGGAAPRNPIRVRVLGEDLVLFRDASGKPGLLAEHCSHRGTSLFCGRVEESCLRCLYHGWAYDREGNVIEPIEQKHQVGGADRRLHRALARRGVLPIRGWPGAGRSDPQPEQPESDFRYLRQRARGLGGPGWPLVEPWPSLARPALGGRASDLDAGDEPGSPRLGSLAPGHHGPRAGAPARAVAGADRPGA